MSNENTFTLDNFQNDHARALSIWFFQLNKNRSSTLPRSQHVPGAIAAYFIESRGPVQNYAEQSAVMSGVLANTGGVPLAFMFYAALGIQGSTYKSYLNIFGWDIYAGTVLTWNILHRIYLIVYLYFPASTYDHCLFPSDRGS